MDLDQELLTCRCWVQQKLSEEIEGIEEEKGFTSWWLEQRSKEDYGEKQNKSPRFWSSWLWLGCFLFSSLCLSGFFKVMHLVWKVLKTPSLRGASNICIGGVSWKCRGYLILSKKGGYLGIRYIKGMVKLVSAEWILVCWRTHCVFVWIVQSSTWTNFQDLKSGFPLKISISTFYFLNFYKMFWTPFMFE